MSAYSKVVGGALSFGNMVAGNAKAMLIPEDVGFPVQFSFNPTKVSLTRKAENHKQNTTSNPLQQTVTETSPVTISISGALLAGAVVTQAAIDQLANWAQPAPTASMANRLGRMVGRAMTVADDPGAFLRSGSGTLGAAAKQVGKELDRQADHFFLGMAGINVRTMPATTVIRRFAAGGASPAPTFVPSPGMTETRVYRLPVLTFMWGVGGPMGAGTKVQIKSLGVEYKRFDWTGIPVLASVDLTLEVYEPERPYTNPTSGGLPGRAKHLLTQGEDIVRVATRTYGTPTAWRAVAQANGLDDPLRLRPGRTLYLPGPAELGQEADT